MAKNSGRPHPKPGDSSTEGETGTGGDGAVDRWAAVDQIGERDEPPHAVADERDRDLRMLLAQDLEKAIEVVQVLPERSYVTAPSPGAPVTAVVVGVNGKPARCEPGTEAFIAATVFRVPVHQRKGVPRLRRQPSAAE